MITRSKRPPLVPATLFLSLIGGGHPTTPHASTFEVPKVDPSGRAVKITRN
jgi:hypothetical protein